MAASSIATAMVALLSDLPTAGIYGAALRVVEAAVIPFYAFMFSVLPRFFRSGASGVEASLRLAVRMLPAALTTTLLGCLCIVLIAPLIPLVLGDSYTGTATVIWVLTPIPMVYGLYLLAADVLMSSRHVGWRVILQCLMPIVNIVLCVVLVPPFGALGAALSVLISNAILAAAAWSLAKIMANRDGSPDYDRMAVSLGEAGCINRSHK
jgi:O-antigen/teichoic acid export membrane protein